MPWQGTSCPLAAGWQQRLASKVLLAGICPFSTPYLCDFVAISLCPLPQKAPWKSVGRGDLCAQLRSQLVFAAGLGSAAGAVLAILERKPMLPHIRGTAASAAICLGFFGGALWTPILFPANHILQTMNRSVSIHLTTFKFLLTCTSCTPL